MKSRERAVLLLAVAAILLLAGCVANPSGNISQKSVIPPAETPTLPERYVAAPAVQGGKMIGAASPKNSSENISLPFGPETTHAFINGSSSSGSGSFAAPTVSSTRILPFVTVTNSPAAQFTWNLKPEDAPVLRVQFTDTSNFHPVSWSWDFGDGTYSSAQNPSHVYRNEGTYTVRFTSGDIAGCHSSSRQITVYDPGRASVSFTANRTEGDSPLAVQFNDTTDYPFILPPPSWYWDFDDGSDSTLQNPDHAFVFGKKYNVILMVTNPRGPRYFNKTIEVSRPETRFTSNVTLGYAPLAVQFNDTSIHAANATLVPTTYSWDFGDGSFSLEQNPVHTFNSGRYFNVTFNVTSRAGTSSANSTIAVYKPGFIIIPHYGGNPLAVFFQDTGTGYPEPTAWHWDFGDGYTSDKRNMVHQYVAPGTYNVRFRVTGPAGTTWVNKTAAVTVT
jgi:PKD repeat protein